MSLPDIRLVICPYCNNAPLILSDEVWFCFRCQIGHSIHSYTPGLYDDHYSLEYKIRGESDIGRRLTALRTGLVLSFVKSGAFVDYGCGNGSVVEAVSKYATAWGVEANKETADKIAARIHGRVETPEEYLARPDNSFCGGIAFFDSLEHFPDIHKTFDAIVAKLVPGGVVIITMPELQSCFASTHDEAYLKQIFARWRHNKPKEHLTYFTLQGMRRFFDQHNLELVNTNHLESFLRWDGQENPLTNIMMFVGLKKW